MLFSMCRERDSNPHDLFGSRDFLTTIAFTQSISVRCCSLDYFFTMSIEMDLGIACIVSTPFIGIRRT